MRLDKILNAVIPGMYDTPCKIAIFTNGRKIKVFEKTCFRSLDFNTPVPQNWVRNYNLENSNHLGRLKLFCGKTDC